MVTLLLLSALALSGARAQEAPSLPAADQQVVATWWVVQEAELQRWPDGGPAVRTLEVGDEVELVLREGELVRVRKDLDFGWLPASALSDQPPAG